ncbi:MAG: hypothetical protein L0H74_06710 [Brachybacterium sp.]|nr:hypothetical protein [Brachybacterium sp.]MDN5899746.1 hypothetical protein [Brachybacterium sp.]
MKNVRSRIAAAAVLGTLLLGGMGAAYAGNSYDSFSTTVPRINGLGSTGYQTKAISDAHVQFNSTMVGGNYVVDARAEGPSYAGPWSRNVDDGDARSLTNTINSGSNTRISFSNDLTTLQNVQVSGKWRSQ